MEEQEIWKDIPDYEGLYQVSNLGRVKSLSREITSEKFEKYSRVTKERIMKNILGKRGYYTLVLVNCKGTKKNWTIHRLVAITFIPNPENLREVDHIDCNKLNNNIDNLEWVSPKENTKRAWKNGRCKKSRKSGRDKHSEELVKEIKQKMAEGMKNKEISQTYGVKEVWASALRTGRVWPNL